MLKKTFVVFYFYCENEDHFCLIIEMSKTQPFTFQSQNDTIQVNSQNSGVFIFSFVDKERSDVARNQAGRSFFRNGSNGASPLRLKAPNFNKAGNRMSS